MTKDDAKAIQTALGLTPDGNLTTVQQAALQAKLGVNVDGKLGPVTISALQRRLGGIPVDGLMGPLTRQALLVRGYAAMYPNKTGGAKFDVPSISMFAIDTKKLAIAAFGIAFAALFAFAAKR